jgi:hypothetical protein
MLFFNRCCGIRGGVALINLGAAGKLEVIFVYGKAVTVSGANVSQTITRPGFEVTVSGFGAAPSNPAPAPPGTTAALLAQLDGRTGGTGGAQTETVVAASGIADVISNNVTASVQAADQTQPPAPQSPNVNRIVQQTQLQVQNAANQPTIRVSPPVTSVTSVALAISTPPVTSIPPVTSTPPATPITLAGIFKSTNGAGTAHALPARGRRSRFRLQTEYWRMAC